LEKIAQFYLPTTSKYFVKVGILAKDQLVQLELSAITDNSEVTSNNIAEPTTFGEITLGYRTGQSQHLRLNDFVER